jgi:hypothetical protein
MSPISIAVRPVEVAVDGTGQKLVMFESDGQQFFSIPVASLDELRSVGGHLFEEMTITITPKEKAA